MKLAQYAVLGARLFSHAGSGRAAPPALFILALVFLAATAPAYQETKTADATPGGAGQAPLIPRQLLFGNPEKAAPAVSPNGKRIAYLAPDEGVLNVWVGPLANPSAAQPVTNDRGRGIRNFFWAYTNDDILYTQDEGGNENWRVYRVNLTTRQVKDLTPFANVQARVQEVSHKHPGHILVGINNRDPSMHDIHRVNLVTGEMKLVQRNDAEQGGGFVGFITDSDYRVRFGVRMLPDGGQEIMQAGENGAWSSFIKLGPDDALTTEPVGFNDAGDKLYLLDSRERDTAALTAVDPASGAVTVLAQDPRADIQQVIRHPLTKQVQAAAGVYERQDWQVLDDAIRNDLEMIKSLYKCEIDLVSRSLDDRYWIVSALIDTAPLRYMKFERDSRQGQLLFSTRPALLNYKLASMRPVRVRSRDGFNLICYLTLPPGTADPDSLRPLAPLPMVLLVHGGPWGRDEWGYNTLHQWLANRGYAVLSVNFRGSTGFGKRFVNAGDLEWAAKMHDDLVDSVRWAVDSGVADPKRVAIMGGSYGGYATLVGLTFTPDLFACGVDIVGPSNLVTLLESIPPYWTPMLSLFTKRVGDHRTEEGRQFLRERSPLTFVDRIRKPLLIGQGANDPRVKQAEADQIVQAMQAKKIPVTYVLYPDEGHGFARPENRLSFYAVTEAFLAEHLGGRVEPFGEDFKGSSIQVPVGAGEIGNLEGALPK